MISCFFESIFTLSIVLFRFWGQDLRLVFGVKCCILHDMGASTPFDEGSSDRLGDWRFLESSGVGLDSLQEGVTNLTFKALFRAPLGDGVGLVLGFAGGDHFRGRGIFPWIGWEFQSHAGCGASSRTQVPDLKQLLF